MVAVASFLDARSHAGKWLLRIDDLDAPRVTEEAETQIIGSLRRHGLDWDDDIRYQRDHTKFYEQFLAELVATEQVFFCTCSRREIDNAIGCVRSCSTRIARPDEPHSIRIHTSFQSNYLCDRVQGPDSTNGMNFPKNVSIWRREGIPTYPLAVITDDNITGVTHVVRGSDLLENTNIQAFLMQQLDLRSVSYAHIPVLTERNGIKLSKRDSTTRIDDRHARQNLLWSMQLLGMDPPQKWGVDDLLKWGLDEWSVNEVPSGARLTNFHSV